MATCFLTLSFEVSAQVASNCVIWPRVCPVYLLLKPLANGFRVLFHNVSYTSKLYNPRASVRCFTGAIREYGVLYRSRVAAKFSNETSASISARQRKIYIFLTEASAKFAFGK